MRSSEWPERCEGQVEVVNGEDKIVCEYVQKCLGGIRRVVFKKFDLGDSFLSQRTVYFLGVKVGECSVVTMKKGE